MICADFLAGANLENGNPDVLLTSLRRSFGRLADEDMVRLNRAILVFLGIAAPPSNEQLESA